VALVKWILIFDWIPDHKLQNVRNFLLFSASHKASGVIMLISSANMPSPLLSMALMVFGMIACRICVREKESGK